MADERQNTTTLQEEGPKLVRTNPDSNSNNYGKINLLMILLPISLVLIVLTIIMLFNV